MLSRRGARVVHGATMATSLLGDLDETLDATHRVLAEPVDTVVLTTGIGTRSWFAAAESAGLDDALRRHITSARVVARGPKALHRRGPRAWRSRGAIVPSPDRASSSSARWPVGRWASPSPRSTTNWSGSAVTTTEGSPIGSHDRPRRLSLRCGDDRPHVRPRRRPRPPGGGEVRRPRRRRWGHGRRRRPGRSVARTAHGTRRAPRLRRRHVVALVEDDPRRHPLPAAVRDPARLPVAARAPADAGQRAPPRPHAALRDGDLHERRDDPPVPGPVHDHRALVLRRHRRRQDRGQAQAARSGRDDPLDAVARPGAHRQQLPVPRRPGRRRPARADDRPHRRARPRRRRRQPRPRRRAAQGRRRRHRRRHRRRRRRPHDRRPGPGRRQRRRRLDRRRRLARRRHHRRHAARPRGPHRRAPVDPAQRLRRDHVGARQAGVGVRGALGGAHVHRHDRHGLRRRPRPPVLHRRRRPPAARRAQRLDHRRGHAGGRRRDVGRVAAAAADGRRRQDGRPVPASPHHRLGGRPRHRRRREADDVAADGRGHRRRGARPSSGSGPRAGPRSCACAAPRAGTRSRPARSTTPCATTSPGGTARRRRRSSA